jgi:hypothetical protein
MYTACPVILTKFKKNLKKIDLLDIAQCLQPAEKRDVLTTAQRIENTDKTNRREYRSGLWGERCR